MYTTNTADLPTQHTTHTERLVTFITEPLGQLTVHYTIGNFFCILQNYSKLGNYILPNDWNIQIQQSNSTPSNRKFLTSNSCYEISYNFLDNSSLMKHHL